MSRSRVRTEIANGRWRLIARGIVLTRPDPPTRRDWALCGLAMGGSSAALSGWDAVRLVGLGSPRPPVDPVLILTSTGPSRTLGDVHLRRVMRAVAWRTTSVLDENLPLIRVATVPRAIADTALCCSSLGAVRALVGRALQLGLCTVDDLAVELSLVRRRDSAYFRRALAEVAAGARSAAEADAIGQLTAARVPPFEVNAPVLDAHGRVIAVADVLWRDLRAIIEIDSQEFHFFTDDWRATMLRHNRLVAAGFAVSHYPPSALRSGSGWVDDVATWLRARSAELGHRAEPDSVVR